MNSESWYKPPFVRVTIADAGGQVMGAIGDTALLPSRGRMIEIETSGALVRVPV
jgi:hypothetical protein